MDIPNLTMDAEFMAVVNEHMTAAVRDALEAKKSEEAKRLFLAKVLARHIEVVIYRMHFPMEASWMSEKAKQIERAAMDIVNANRKVN